MTSIATDCTPTITNVISSTCNGTSKTPSSHDSVGTMNSEKNRLNTFRSWPVQAPVSADRLAKAGFFYTGHDTEVECFSCGLRIGEWSYNDIAMDKHKRFFPSCDFVNNKSDNIPFIAHSSRTATNVRVSGSSPAVVARGPSQESATGNGNLLYEEPRAGNEETSNNVRVKQNLGGNNINELNPVLPSTSSSQIPIVNGINGLNERVNAGTRLGSPGESSTNSASNGTEHQNNSYQQWISPELHSSVNRAIVETFERRMHYEGERLKTFSRSWPLSFLNPRELARAGFYYLQVSDKCKCAFCRGVLMNWSEGDVPMVEHCRNFPLCPFVMRQQVGNIPLDEGRDECGLSNMYETIFSEPERNGGRRSSPVHNGSISHKGPMHPSQATIEARLRSFQSWPSWSPMKAEALAEAGFFYIGIRDNTKCFYCDIGLCNWEPEDDAWIEHARWSKNCAYVILFKGEEFINSCQIKVEPTPRKNSPTEVTSSPYSAAIEEAMQSDLVQNVLKTKVYPPILIQKALQRKFETTGRGVSNVAQLSEAVMIEIEEAIPQTRSSPSLPSPAIGNISNIQNGQTPAGTGTSDNTPVEEQQRILENELSPEEELRQLKESRVCKVCLDREIEVVFLPCGHQVACRQCALALKDCAICRKPVTSIIRTFLP